MKAWALFAILCSACAADTTQNLSSSGTDKGRSSEAADSDPALAEASVLVWFNVIPESRLVTRPLERYEIERLWGAMNLSDLRVHNNPSPDLASRARFANVTYPAAHATTAAKMWVEPGAQSHVHVCVRADARPARRYQVIFGHFSYDRRERTLLSFDRGTYLLRSSVTDKDDCVQ